MTTAELHARRSDDAVSYLCVMRDRELAAMGRTPADVRALILTHGHSDHIGFAERLRRERRIPVSVHEADAALARGEVPNPAKGYGPVKLGPLLGFLWFTLLHGGLRTPKLQQVATFGDGATLDVPGGPRVILTPGHTPGSAALHFASLGALFVGDAFATYAVTTGARGPRSRRSPQTPPRRSNRWHAWRRSPPIRCFLGMATPGPAASRRQSGRYGRRIAEAANPATSTDGMICPACRSSGGSSRG